MVFEYAFAYSDIVTLKQSVANLLEGKRLIFDTLLERRPLALFLEEVANERVFLAF